MIRRTAVEACPLAWLRPLVGLGLLCLLAACGSHPAHHTASHYAPTRYYPPPGPPGDPWGPYIREASGRFGVPELWVRRVMRQESGGQEDVISGAGAMGLMQVMPDTYDGLRSRYGLGGDPFDPHNNILAGTAYLREMYDRFGAPGFLAAYNAGPNRLDGYLRNGSPLPAETVAYVAAIAPRLGPGTPMSGPLAVYAGGGVYVARGPATGCDPDAAYNPDGPCVPARPVVMAAAAPVYADGVCDPDAAYDPSRPCRPAPVSAPVVAEVLPPPAWRGAAVRAEAVSYQTAGWAIQVGAFGNLATAEAAADTARAAVPELLRSARTELPPTAPLGGRVAFRARLAGLTPGVASDACMRLSQLGLPCITVPPL